MFAQTNFSSQFQPYFNFDYAQFSYSRDAWGGDHGHNQSHDDEHESEHEHHDDEHCQPPVVVAPQCPTDSEQTPHPHHHEEEHEHHHDHDHCPPPVVVTPQIMANNTQQTPVENSNSTSNTCEPHQQHEHKAHDECHEHHHQPRHHEHHHHHDDHCPPPVVVTPQIMDGSQLPSLELAVSTLSDAAGTSLNLQDCVTQFIKDTCATIKDILPSHCFENIAPPEQVYADTCHVWQPHGCLELCPPVIVSPGPVPV